MKRRIVLSSTIDVTDGVHHAVQQGNRRRTAARHTVVERPRGTRDAFATRVSPSSSSAQARQDTTRYNRIQPDSMATASLFREGFSGVCARAHEDVGAGGGPSTNSSMAFMASETSPRSACSSAMSKLLSRLVSLGRLSFVQSMEANSSPPSQPEGHLVSSGGLND
jgi:hypothetical protein